MSSEMGKIRQPIPAAEWFDLDREQKTMENRIRETRQQLLDRATLEGWEGIFDECPFCMTGAVVYGPDDRQDNHYENHYACSCTYCDKEWLEDIPEENEHD